MDAFFGYLSPYTFQNKDRTLYHKEEKASEIQTTVHCIHRTFMKQAGSYERATQHPDITRDPASRDTSENYQGTAEQLMPTASPE